MTAHTLSLVAFQTTSSTGPGGGPGAASSAAGGLFALLFLLFIIALVVIVIVGMWKVFEKAGQPGWAAIIPILNLYFMCKIAGRPGWWLLLYFIPIVSLVVSIIVLMDISKAFGKGVGTMLGLLFLPFIFFPILGFGDAQYQGPAQG